MTSWSSLYLPCADNVVETLKDALKALGYQLYDPFGLIPGKAYPQAVRLFVAPAREGWTRIIGELDADLLAPLSQIAPCLQIQLDGPNATIAAYENGSSVAPSEAFAAYISQPDCIQQALDLAVVSKNDTLGAVALDMLPGDVQNLAQKVDLKQAGKMFNRLSGNLAPKSGGDASANDLLRQPEWNSLGGARIAALMNCLRVANWRDPDFVTLRDAYALSERRRRSPKATLYPGDAETMAAVPDALSYTPVYAGKAP
jgi:hypothetical protein